MTTLHFRNSISRSPSRRGFPVVLLALVLGLFAPLPTVRAVDPPPDGGYPNRNTAEGDGALFTLSTVGANNTAIGFDALYHATDGSSFNTAIGCLALFSNTAGQNNVATGDRALYSNATGSGNAASGFQALFSNTTGDGNIAAGDSALFNNTIGSFNIAIGTAALAYNTTGNHNVAIGFEALFSNGTNGTGNYNIAIGFKALYSNTTGNSNTANGVNALNKNRTGNSNTANGFQTLYNNTTGIRNTATGVSALQFNKAGNSNTAEGFGALRQNTGSFNTALGFGAGANLTTGSDNIDIGAPGVAGESGTLRIGTGKTIAAYIRGIYGQTVASGVGVIIDSSGHLGTTQSSERFKETIKPMDKASEVILSLKPVTFRYKHELDPDGVPQFGLIAEQVDKVNPDLVVRGEDGKVTTVRYEAVNAMLLNEFLKEHRKVEELKAVAATQAVAITQHQSTISELKTRVAKVQDLEKQVAALTAGLQKVTAQIETAKTAPRVVSDN